MIQIQTMRLSSMNALIVSSRQNVILTHEEAESGAVTADDLGKNYFSNPNLNVQKQKTMMGKSLIKLCLLETTTVTTCESHEFVREN